ncbi:YgjP-like metallopeptidase domain-containing protein, partial [Rhizobium ruizarguesonis]
MPVIISSFRRLRRLIFSDRATRITLRIETGGRALKMTVPKGLAAREVNAFLDSHQGWLLTKLAKFSTDAGLRDGGEILLRG